MDRLIVLPWENPWWPELVALAEKEGSSAAEIIDLVQRQHAFGLSVDPDSLFLVACADDQAFVIWLVAGRNARRWIGRSEQAVRHVAAQHGVTKLRVEEGRRGWARLLPHWTAVGENLEINL